MKSCNFTKKRPWHRCFPVNFAKLLRTPFLQNTPGRLRLHHPLNVPWDKFRSSHQRCSIKKGVLKRLWHRFFPVNFAKFLRIPFSEHLRTTVLTVHPLTPETPRRALLVTLTLELTLYGGFFQGDFSRHLCTPGDCFCKLVVTLKFPNSF